MSKSMYQKIVYLFLIFFLIISCSKKELELNLPADKEKSFEIYKEAVEAMNKKELFYASKKFSEAEVILPTIELSAKASLMSSYCLYLINFYSEATENLERFINQYVDSAKNGNYNDFLHFYQMIDVLIVDDVQFLAKKEKTQEIFFQIFNYFMIII